MALSLDTNLNPDFNLHNPFFFAVAVGSLLEGRVALLNLPPLDTAILSGYNRNPPQLLCGLRPMFNVSFETLIDL